MPVIPFLHSTLKLTVPTELVHALESLALVAGMVYTLTLLVAPEHRLTTRPQVTDMPECFKTFKRPTLLQHCLPSPLVRALRSGQIKWMRNSGRALQLPTQVQA